MISRLVAIIVVVGLLASFWSVEAADCNGNGTDDAADIDFGTSADCNSNGIPDECDLSGGGFRLESGPSVPLSPAVPLNATMAAGDLDGDRDLDLIVSHDTQDGQVTVLLNAGDATFQAGPHLVAGSRPEGVALGDLDGDLDLDIAVANLFSSSVSVFFNSGLGVFPKADGIGLSFVPSNLALGDMDGDRDLDLLVLAQRTQTFGDGLVFPNNGDGTFGSGIGFATGGGTYSPVLGDFDGDLDLDLVVANPVPGPVGGKITVLLNQGNGVLGAPKDFTVPVQSAPRSLVAVDLDGDGDLDLASLMWGTKDLALLLNQGDGTFAPAQNVTVGVTFATALTAGDLDGDLDPDLVVMAYRTSLPPGIELALLLNDGAGGFTVSMVPVCDSCSPGFVVPADLDGDLDVDVAVASNRLFVLLNVGAPPTSRDENSNGIPDECETHFHRGDANASTGIDVADAIFTLSYLFAHGTVPSCLDAADANDDGSPNVGDPIKILAHLFARAGPLPAPFDQCGIDPTIDDLNCSSFLPCEGP